MGIETCERNDVGLTSSLKYSWLPTRPLSTVEVELALGNMDVGETGWVEGKVVCRWSADEFEVVTYGRRHFRLRDAATIIVD